MFSDLILQFAIPTKFHSCILFICVSCDNLFSLNLDENILWTESMVQRKFEFTSGSYFHVLPKQDPLHFQLVLEVIWVI